MAEDPREAVIQAAVVWWRYKRPMSWSFWQHLEEPDVNTTTGSEQRLARAVAKMAKEGK